MKKRNERGVALVLALLVLSLLMALILGFDAEARREIREAVAFRDTLKATTLARSGVQAARAILQHDVRLDLQFDRPYDALTDIWAKPMTDYPLGDGMLTATIEDERGKLNLNDLANQPDFLARRAKMDRLKRLFELVQVDPRLVEAVSDWVDADETPEPNGAESAYYQSLKPPYRAANAPLQTLAELYLIKGFTDDLVKRIARYVTVYPTSSDGWINLNTADPLVIQALDQRVTSSMALEVMQGRPFRTLQDVDRATSFASIARELRLANLYSVKSDFFSARIAATVNEVTKVARAVFRRSNVTGESILLYFRVE